jgi:hypothetical protein
MNRAWAASTCVFIASVIALAVNDFYGPGMDAALLLYVLAPAAVGSGIALADWRATWVLLAPIDRLSSPFEVEAKGRYLLHEALFGHPFFASEYFRLGGGVHRAGVATGARAAATLLPLGVAVDSAGGSDTPDSAASTNSHRPASTASCSASPSSTAASGTRDSAVSAARDRVSPCSRMKPIISRTTSAGAISTDDGGAGAAEEAPDMEAPAAARAKSLMRVAVCVCVLCLHTLVLQAETESNLKRRVSESRGREAAVWARSCTKHVYTLTF